MTTPAAQTAPPAAAPDPGPVVERLTTDALHALLDDLARLTHAGTDTEAITQLEALERLKSAAAAAQASITTRIAAERAHQYPTVRGHEAATGAEIALARRESPAQGRRHLHLARGLLDMPATAAALGLGDISEYAAMIITEEAHPLTTREDRHSVDAALFPDALGLGHHQLRGLVRTLVIATDPDAATRRSLHARAGRHVTGRLGADGTGRITAIVNAEDLTGVIGALETHAASAKAAGDPRCRDAIKADTLVERITNPTTGDSDTDNGGASPKVRVNLLIGAESLLGDDDTPGHLTGPGTTSTPLPAAICRQLVATAHQAGLASLRRLFATPGDRELIAMTSRDRHFPTGLAHLIHLRDGGTCRTPWCNGPIRHTDHPHPVHQGGETSIDNSQGLCEACNYTKEHPGWTTAVRTNHGHHQVSTLTPAMHHHTSRPPPLPGRTSAAAHGTAATGPPKHLTITDTQDQPPTTPDPNPLPH